MYIDIYMHIHVYMYAYSPNSYRAQIRMPGRVNESERTRGGGYKADM